MKRSKLIVILLGIMLPCFSQQPEAFTRENKYNRLSFSAADLKDLASSIQYYHLEKKKDSAHRDDAYYISCEISGNKKSRNLNDFKQIQELALGTEDYSELVLTYNSDSSPITTVRISCNNFWRRLTVIGTDEKKVNAVFNELDQKIEKKEGFLAFINWETIFTFCLYIIFMMALFLFLSTFNPAQDQNRGDRVKMKIFSASILLLLVLYYYLPFGIKDLLPTFELSQDNMPWYNKYGGIIGALGLLPLVSYCYGFIRKNVNFSYQAAQEDNQTITENPTLNPEQEDETPTNN